MGITSEQIKSKMVSHFAVLQHQLTPSTAVANLLLYFLNLNLYNEKKAQSRLGSYKRLGEGVNDSE